MRHFLLPTIILSFCFFAAGVARADDPCLGCHDTRTGGLVDVWRKSIHFEKNVGCADCHGTDIDANHERRTIVDGAVCGVCHKKALNDHRLSKHGIGMKSGTACTRAVETSSGKEKSCLFCHKQGSASPLVAVECAMFLAQSPEMQRQGCTSCHQVEMRCDTCHTKHGTDLALSRKPEVCGVCHMGPDHPQMEMWETSLHGVLYRNGSYDSAPSCVTCHMDGGSHNVSRGIATGLSGEDENMRRKERGIMLSICSRCHTESLAKRNLDDGDAVERQSGELVEEAKGIIAELNDQGLLFPGPEERPPHPLLGGDFVIGPHMLYENLSFTESLFFKMKQFYYGNTYKGVFHQNPDYAHWYGNAPLKLALSEIKSHAVLLRKLRNLEKRVDNLDMSPGEEDGEISELKALLRQLKRLSLKGRLSEEEYEKTRALILDEKGL